MRYMSEIVYRREMYKQDPLIQETTNAFGFTFGDATCFGAMGAFVVGVTLLGVIVINLKNRKYVK